MNKRPVEREYLKERKKRKTNGTKKLKKNKEDNSSKYLLIVNFNSCNIDNLLLDGNFTP